MTEQNWLRERLLQIRGATYVAERLIENPDEVEQELQAIEREIRRIRDARRDGPLHAVLAAAAKFGRAAEPS
jgi:molybdopterin-guanine dinucleotide biosynthesis protein A